MINQKILADLILSAKGSFVELPERGDDRGRAE
jgi:hypothetical protein